MTIARDGKIEPQGFREYDARWLYPQQIDDLGVKRLGAALGTYFDERGAKDGVVVGYDYRSYSEKIKNHLVEGLVSVGARVIDIGLCLSPIAYFAQIFLKAPAMAMVTASHNENGWTGVKMGCDAPLTFGPDEINRLKHIALNEAIAPKPNGEHLSIDNIAQAYMDDLTQRGVFSRKLRIVLACGNGTAGFFAPKVFEALGAHVIALHCQPDWDFPHYTPNPENMAMMNELAQKVLAEKADLGLAFDGDGDRCGYVDEKGNIIFADKLGVLLARHIALNNKKARFIADVKSTGIFTTDPVLRQAQAKTDFWMTGHSYMKKRLHESGAQAAFEKSGHFFFAHPIGRGYDDGLLSGIMLCETLCAQNKDLSALVQSLPKSWNSPTMAPFCPDDKKYHAVEVIAQHYQKLFQDQTPIAGRVIKKLITVNGIRIILEDGSWLLARASSNKPSLVIVIESTRSQDDLRDLFADMDKIIAQIPDIGDYDQKL